MTPFRLFDRLRRGGTVERYHTHRVLRRQNVAEHSFNVALLADTVYYATFREPLPHRALLAALHHDLPEYDTGDSPAPAKRRSPALKAALDEMDAEAFPRLGLISYTELSPGLARLVGACDELEFLTYALDERRLGNADMDYLMAHGSAGLQVRLNTMDFDWVSVAQGLLDDLLVEYASVGGDRWFLVQYEVHQKRDYLATLSTVGF